MLINLNHKVIIIIEKEYHVVKQEYSLLSSAQPWCAVALSFSFVYILQSQNDYLCKSIQHTSLDTSQPVCPACFCCPILPFYACKHDFTLFKIAHMLCKWYTKSFLVSLHTYTLLYEMQYMIINQCARLVFLKLCLRDICMCPKCLYIIHKTQLRFFDHTDCALRS